MYYGDEMDSRWNEPDDLDQVMAEYGLPGLPQHYDGPGARNLILFRQEDEKVVLTQCTLEDAQAYCSRDDTRGNDWFTGFQEVN